MEDYKGTKNATKEESQKVADLAFKTNKLGQTTFSELAKSMGRVVKDDKSSY